MIGLLKIVLYLQRLDLWNSSSI